MRSLRVVSTLGLFLAVPACAAVSGLADLRIDDGAFDGGDGATHDGSLPEAGCGRNEICDDGVDNDCNGRVDCADPACTSGYQCVPAPPEDWRLVSANLSGRTSCPNDFPTAVDVVVAPADGPASCACTCGTSDDTCTEGAYSLSYGASCASGPIALDAGACELTTVSLAQNTQVQLAPPPPPATCSAKLNKAIGPPPQGRLCDGARNGGGCPSGSICAPRVNAPQVVCIAQRGVEACPAPYSSKLVVGSGVASDTRDCTTCACTPGACAATATLSEKAMCNGRSLVVQTSTMCTTPGNQPLAVSSYMVVPNGNGCSVSTPSTVSGSISLADEQTVCCR
jgi:hypothetical protein